MNEPRIGPQSPGREEPSSEDRQQNGTSRGRSESVTGPFTARDISVFASVFVMLVGSVLPLVIVRGFVGNLWNSVSLFFLGIGILLPLAVAALFALRRMRPESRFRIGSLSIDQFASVVAVLAFAFFFLQTVASYSIGALIALVGSFGFLASTTAAPHLPRFASDFAGREEIPAHIVARDAVPALPRPVKEKPQEQKPGQLAPAQGGNGQEAVAAAAGQTGHGAAGHGEGEHRRHHEFIKHDRPVQPHPSPSQQGAIPVDQYQMRHPHERHGIHRSGQGAGTAAGGAAGAGAAGAGAAAGAAAAGAAAGTAPGDARVDKGTAVSAAGKTAPEKTGAEKAGAEKTGAAQPGAARTGAQQQADAQGAGAGMAGAGKAGGPETGAPSGSTAVAAAPAGAGVSAVRDATAVDLPRVEEPRTDSFSATMEAKEEEPVYEAFWVAVPEPRPVVDERTGAVLFTAEPGRWLLVLQDRGDEYLVKEQDQVDPETGQPIDGTGTAVGIMRNITNLERG